MTKMTDKQLALLKELAPTLLKMPPKVSIEASERVEFAKCLQRLTDYHLAFFVGSCDGTEHILSGNVRIEKK